MPKDYKPGKTKYVVITGSVISGIGKGTISSSLSKLLQDRGLNVEPIKLEAYLNVDSGTLNPFRHGEVFVLDDGAETDLDLGTYERSLDKNLSGENFVTSGKIYQRIIEKERSGKYLGRDVQFIPHVTGEIKIVLRNLAVKTKADVILIEIGGTVGDYENMFALEALRELHYEEGHENVCFINITYIMQPRSLGEQKSKAAQLGIKRLIEMGIQPDVIVCRSESKLQETIKKKISLNVNVPMEMVFGCHDVSNIYGLPLSLRKMGFDEAVLKMLELEKRFKSNGNKALKEWTKKTSVQGKAKPVTIGIAGKYTGSSDTYISILKALEHCSFKLNRRAKVKWIDTTDLNSKEKVKKALADVDGVIVPGGFGIRGIEGKVAVSKYCREHKIPYLGLCLGFQIALIDFARNALNLKDANSTEFDPKAKHPVVDILPEQKEIEGLGGNMRLGGQDVALKEGTAAARLHGNAKSIRRRFRHRFECNPEYIEQFERAGIVFSGKAPKYPIMQILELPKHSFFMATQFHPEFTSRPLNPDP
ncbi:MAG: CTP synthase (glutamine hydrolyzing), partial [Candidatus Diapherotrites archaeon]|nr:CTP synthase (glutamine hydrolyzing) [Candidatus Diapherotrites archaeon]